MADHFAGPRRRTEDVQALGRGGRPGRSAGPFLGDPRQGFGSDGKILPDRRHSGSRARRDLDPPVTGEGRDREPGGGRGLDRGFAASSTRQDRQDRWRGAAAGVAGLQAGRAAGVFDGAGSHASGRGSPPDLARAQDAERRAETACSSDQRPAAFSGARRLRAAAPGSTPSAGGGSHGRRACAGREHEGANRTRAGPARISARPDRGDRGRTRRGVGEAGRGRGGPGRPGRARVRAEADGPERPGRGNRARGRGGPGRPERPERAGARPEADGSERPGRGNRGHALDGGVLPLVRQSPAARRFRRIGGNAVEERLDRSRTGRLDGQSPLAPHDDPICFVVANPPAELGADALVPRADQGRDQAAEEEDGRRAGAQAARGVVAIRRRRRRDRGRRAEARRPGALRPPQGANVFSRIRRGPINLGRSGWANRWIAWPEKPKRRGDSPSRAYRLRKRNQGAVAETRRPNVRLFRLSTRTLERLGPGSKDSKTRGETHETLKSTRSAQSRQRLPTRRALDLMFVRLPAARGRQGRAMRVASGELRPLTAPSRRKKRASMSSTALSARLNLASATSKNPQHEKLKSTIDARIPM